MNTTPTHIIIDGDAIAIQPADSALEYLVTTKEVARGYGVSEATLRTHKRDHADELIEGKHWVVNIIHPLGGSDNLSEPSTGVGNTNARYAGLKRGNDTVTLWTKRGVIRLGFFIRSERAKRFRDAAEDLILSDVRKSDTAPQPAAQHANSPELVAILTHLTQIAARNTVGVENLTHCYQEMVRTQLDLQARVQRLERASQHSLTVDMPTVRLPKYRGWRAKGPDLNAVMDADLTRLLLLALGDQRQSALRADQLHEICTRYGLLGGILSPIDPKSSLGILLTRLNGKTVGGVTITKHRLARERRYILTRSK
jgi:uncharacterized protein YigA (DUF484 family)